MIEEVYNLEDALLVGGVINTLLRHADRVRVACLAQLVNVIAPLVTNPSGVLRQTIYYPYAWALEYARGDVLDLVVESPSYEVPGIGPVPYLDVAAIADAKTGESCLLILNRDLENERELAVVWRDSSPTRVLACQVLTGPDLKASNSFDEPHRVAPQPLEAPRPGDRMTLKVPRQSYTAVHLSSA